MPNYLHADCHWSRSVGDHDWHTVKSRVPLRNYSGLTLEFTRPFAQRILSRCLAQTHTNSDKPIQENQQFTCVALLPFVSVRLGRVPTLFQIDAAINIGRPGRNLRSYVDPTIDKIVSAYTVNSVIKANLAKVGDAKSRVR